jgi:hypothetical protein
MDIIYPAPSFILICPQFEITETRVARRRSCAVRWSFISISSRESGKHFVQLRSLFNHNSAAVAFFSLVAFSETYFPSTAELPGVSGQETFWLIFSLMHHPSPPCATQKVKYYMFVSVHPAALRPKQALAISFSISDRRQSVNAETNVATENKSREYRLFMVRRGKIGGQHAASENSIYSKLQVWITFQAHFKNKPITY